MYLYGTPCHAVGHFVFWCNHVTYRTLCYASFHLVIYHECYRFERVFFYSQAFFILHSFLLFSRLPWDRQFNLKVSRASCWSSKLSPGPTICLNLSNPQKRYTGRFYSRIRAVQLRNIKPYRELKYLPYTGFELFLR